MDIRIVQVAVAVIVVVAEIKFYAPRDEQSKAFIIKFADQDVSDIVILDDEECAISTFERMSERWNCYLFELKERK